MELHNETNNDIEQLCTIGTLDTLPIITFGDEINLSSILGENTTDSSIFRDIIADLDIENEFNIVDTNEKHEETLPKTFKLDLAEQYEYLARTISASPGTKNKLDEFTCTVCNKRFPDKRYLNRHLSKHTGRFTCSKCQKSFSRKENMNTHTAKCQGLKNNVKKVRIRPINPDYYCEQCSRQFTRKENFDQHMWKHQGIQVICTLCEKLFRNYKSFKNHRQLHESTRNVYLCNHCATVFFFKSNLRRHIRHYLSSKNDIICQSCDLRVKSEQILAEHASQGKKTCVLCTQAFCLEADLKSHRRFLHPDLWFKCKLCEPKVLFMADSEGYLQEHAKKAHKLTLSFMDCYSNGWYVEVR